MLKLLNEADQFGCTPLHYASKKGQLHTIQQLLKLGAHLNAKNINNQSVLHFAARLIKVNFKFEFE
jgi:ankyrin repeat protein